MYVCIELFFSATVPRIFIENATYDVSEEEEKISVIVSSNGLHITPVKFNIMVTNFSATG